MPGRDNINPTFINVPVPAHRVAEVYALLGREPQSEAATHLPEPSLPDGWTESLLARMYRESPSPMKAFLRHLAEHPDETFNAEEMAAAMDREPRQFAGVLGAYGRRVRNRYSMDEWPFRVERTSGEGLTYMMEEDVAAVIREAVTSS